MKRLLFLLPLCALLQACPFESNVALEKGPVEPVDSSLMGYWYGIVKDGSDFFGIEALDITRESDSTYRIIRYGKAVKGDIILPDTTYFTGYTSWLDSSRYMNLATDILIPPVSRSKNAAPEKRRVYYLATLQLRNDTLDIKTVGENFSQKKTYHSGDELKTQLLRMLQHKQEIFDDLYFMSYRRYPRPTPRAN